MPYPNEHACRLVQPKAGAPTRRKNGAQKHNGKSYDVIFQEQDGKWVEQAYRYPKDSWDADEARAHCKSHDGSFEAASEEKSDPTEKEMRFVKAELRVAGEGKSEKICGYAAVFDQPSEDLGGFTEFVRAGCFKKSIGESDIRALFNHDPNCVMGRNKAGTLKLEEDEVGLWFEVDPPETQWARDLKVSIKRGDIDQCSFGFKTIKDNWHTEEGKNYRDLLEAKLFDVSVVTQPAYPQTSASVRAKIESLKTPPKPAEIDHFEDEPGKNPHSMQDELRKIRGKQVLENVDMEVK